MPPRRPEDMSPRELRDDVFASPDRARSLLTVRAAISFARFVDAPCSFSLSTMCSYWRSRLALQAFCGMSLLSLVPLARTHTAPLQSARSRCYARAVATILLVGVDLFVRGKLEAAAPAHHFVTTDSVDPPDLVVADIARIDPDEVADTYVDVPIDR